jgi:glycerophosphoryl diester phosphodiesterase
MIQYPGNKTPRISAHRGGVGPQLPENCLETFDHTAGRLQCIMEIDLIHSRDQVIVLHHDQTLDRTTTGCGPLAERTFSELAELRLKDRAGNVTPFSIPTLDDALGWANGRTVFVLHRRHVPLDLVIEAIQSHQAEPYAMVMASFQDAIECCRRNPSLGVQVTIDSHQQLQEFDRLGIRPDNVLAFVTHHIPDDPTLFAAIHQRGLPCIVGTHRTLDRSFHPDQPHNHAALRQAYQAIYHTGADILETDLPLQVNQLLAAHPAHHAAPPGEVHTTDQHG